MYNIVYLPRLAKYPFFFLNGTESKHGKANREMIEKMSESFGVPENSIYIISGQTSRKTPPMTYFKFLFLKHSVYLVRL